MPLSAAQGGAFSGDNGPIAFTCGSDICTINPDGSGRSTLLTGATDPSWSSDETQIAFVDTGNGVACRQRGRHIAGLALGAGATSTQPSFSFSGARVAYAKAGDIYTILANTGGGETQLTTTGDRRRSGVLARRHAHRVRRQHRRDGLRHLDDSGRRRRRACR